MTSSPETSPAAAGRSGALREFAIGVSLVWRGFGLWRRRPGLMLFGVLPAVIAAALIVAALVTLGLTVDSLAVALTPFADQWGAGARDAVRALVAIGLLAGIIVVVVYTFTTLTLLIGDRFYERIWRAVEDDLGGFTATPLGVGRTVGESIALVVRALLYAVATFAIGLIPAVGSFSAPVVGILLGGNLLSRELLARPLDARGIGGYERQLVLRADRARAFGFGMMTQLFYLIPGGAIAVMPAAVVGATDLARHALIRALDTGVLVVTPALAEEGD